MATDESAQRVGALRDRIRDLLARQRQQILEEIRAYPTPIPRCDDQFNHLIARRDLLAAELARLDAAVNSSAGASDGNARLLAYIESCAGLDAEHKLRLQMAWREGSHLAPPNCDGPGA
jgi:hypothetical protein